MRLTASSLICARMVTLMMSFVVASMSLFGIHTISPTPEWQNDFAAPRGVEPINLYPLPNPNATCPPLNIDWDSSKREERFPSVKDRVCRYMTVWYDPNYNTPDAWKSPLSFSYVDEVDDTRFKRLAISWNGGGSTTTVLRNAIGPDFPFHILPSEQEVVRDLASYGKKKTWLQYLTTNRIVDRRIELRNNLYSYAKDMLVLLDVFSKQERKMMPPIAAQFGDNELSMKSPLPIWAKWRYINVSHHRRPIPILLKLESDRHYDIPFPIVLKHDIPWDQKRSDKAVFRGMMSGHNLEDNVNAESYVFSDMPIYDACMKVPRCQLVYKYANSTVIDAKLVYVFGKFQEIEGINMVEKQKPIPEMLQYKMIISLEGNDVATGLKWSLLSNSVILMPPPTKTTYAMEELLQPWVHYVPIHDIDRVEEQVQWVLDHDAEAQRISQRATNFIHDMFLHPNAQDDYETVLTEMADRYAQLWFHK